MKINRYQKLLNAVPQWARPEVENFLKVASEVDPDRVELPDGYHPTLQSNLEGVTEHWENRDAFARYQSEDQDEHDQNPEPGKVENRGGIHQFEGNYDDGHLVSQYGEGNLSVYLFAGPESESLYLSKEYGGLYRHSNAREPEKSFSFNNSTNRDARREANPKTEHFSATAPLVPLIEPNLGNPDESTTLFVGARKEIPQRRQALIEQLRSGIEKLPSEQRAPLLNLLSKPDGNTARRLGRELLALEQKSSEISKLREVAGSWQILEDAPKIMADGLVRTQEYFVSPGGLQHATAARQWDVDAETGLPIADTVIVGGGPGGLASGYQMSERGQHTVLFEGGKIGQAFSDASAQSVHQLRTSRRSSGLTYGRDRDFLGVALWENADAIQEKGRQAKSSWNEFRQETNPSDNLGFEGPLNRNNLYEHMLQMGHAMATSCPDTFLIENSPVTQIEKIERGEQTLFQVSSEAGHQLLTRSLVMATGFVGSHGEFARGLAPFTKLEQENPEGVTVLASDHDLVAKNERLSDQSRLVFSDRLMGRPEIREKVKALPKGSRMTVIGSGESAVKGTIEALHLNPELVIDLYTKNPLEPYQVQIPVSHLTYGVREWGLQNKEFADKTMEQFETLKTPITTDALETLLSFEAEGRLRVREMGERFNDKTVDFSFDQNRDKFQFELTDEKVRQSLHQQREAWSAQGLYGQNEPQDPIDEFPEADMVMVAVGYDTQKVNAGPLMQQLVDQDLVEIKDGRVQYGQTGITSEKCPLIAFNTAGAVRMSSDTALPGRAVRGFYLTHELMESLPQRKEPGDVQLPDDLPSLEEAHYRASFIPRSLDEGRQQIREKWASGPKDPEDRAWSERNLELSLRFPSANQTLHVLVGRYLDHPETLTPAEKLSAQRALELATRLENSENRS